MLLNVEQKKLINAKPAGHSLIRGVAGSGKTTVAIHRIPYLLDHYCYEKDDSILMVTFNKTLINYIEHLYEKVENAENAEQLSLNSLFSGANDKKNKVQIINIDKIIYKYFMDYNNENELSLRVTTDYKVIYSIIKKAINLVKKSYPNIKILNDTYSKFILEEIDWIKSCNFCELSQYMIVDRIGRTVSKNVNSPQKLRKNSEIRQAIYEVMLTYKEILFNLGFVDMRDMALYALEQIKKCPKKKFTHIIIDESQDLSRVQLDILRELYKGKDYSSIIFVADIAQNIYTHSWLVKGRTFASIGFDMKGKSNVLSKNYRTTTQVAECAYSLIKKDINITEDDNYVEPSLIDRQGSYPIFRGFTLINEEAKYIINKINNNLFNKYSKKDIAIIARNKNVLRSYENLLKENNMPFTYITGKENAFNKDSIKLLTMHSIKGLEFKVVFIVGLNEGVIPYLTSNDAEDVEYQESMERKLLYVGMTRANELLYLTSSGKPSEFINDINAKYLRIKEGSSFSRFYDVHVDNYKFSKQVHNIYGKEEKVRQWVLNELINTYNYPEELIQLEQRVNSFSRTGLVDIAINTYKNGVKMPYIFVETKAFNFGVKEAKSQLISYMSNCKSVCYGIVTDGNSLVVFDKNGMEIKDIPMFNTSMLKPTLSTLTFEDNNNKLYQIVRDSLISRELSVNANGKTMNYGGNQLTNIPVYGNIAAGIPIEMNEAIEDNFYLPKEWININKDHFILKVKGDSMIDAGINSGDYVLLQAQNTAENRDIVAASQDGGATLKRYMKMGNTVLLVPENPAYEPIQVTSEEARIMGVMVGKIS